MLPTVGVRGRAACVLAGRDVEVRGFEEYTAVAYVVCATPVFVARPADSLDKVVIVDVAAAYSAAINCIADRGCVIRVRAHSPSWFERASDYLYSFVAPPSVYFEDRIGGACTPADVHTVNTMVQTGYVAVCDDSFAAREKEWAQLRAEIAGGSGPWFDAFVRAVQALRMK